MTKNIIKDALVAFGANLPSEGRTPVETVTAAMDHLAQIVPGDVSRSRLFETPAFPPGSGPEFVNSAMRFGWDGSATELLAVLHRVEGQFGRTRTERWEARRIDLDLIALGDEILPDADTQADWMALPVEEAAQRAPDQLILPHPRVAERSFVLVPLADVAPDWVHPVTGLSVTQMLADRPEAERDTIWPLPVGANLPKALSS